MIDNPLLKFQAATIGRLNQGDGRGEGINRVMPEDWHYALRMLPHAYTEAETIDIIARTLRAMVERFCFKGSPKEVAREIRAYVDAGATAHFPRDYAPYLLRPEDQPHALERRFELAWHLKG